MNIKNKKIFILSTVIFSLFFGNLVLSEKNIDNKSYSINLDYATIKKGYTVTDESKKLKLSLVPEILNQATRVNIIKLNEEMDLPWRLEKLSDIYQFEFINKNAYDNHKPFYIQFSYDKQNNNYKKVFFYDKNFNSWRPLPTKDFPKEKFVRSLIHLPFARIAVFSYPEILTSGDASWYAYKPGNYAASPDFPKGSKLRVYNNDNNKFVDVIINDYGPDRKLHQKRVIDLEKNAFAKIAKLGCGIINISIEPLYIAPGIDGKILETDDSGIGKNPKTTVKSAVIISGDSGKIIWEKKSTEILPLASLTKIVAIKTFLDTKPSLDKEVAYSIKDEEHNYEYVNKWESARLRVKDGETMTIKDLLYASLVGSANNAVETLVRVSGLDRNNFIALMNNNVKKWGAKSTYFIEPTGLSPKNVSSAIDYAIISKEVLKNPIIQKASTIKEYIFTTINTKNRHRIKNTNNLIKQNKFNITGSKTGYLDEAGYCLMTQVKKDFNKNLIIVTMGAKTRNISFAETEKLIKFGLKNYD